MRHTSRGLVVVMLIAVGFCLTRGLLDLRASRRLAAEGVATTARVVGKHTELHPGLHSGTYVHYLDVEYRTRAGQVLTQHDRVSERWYRRAMPGDRVPAHYLPGDPALHALGATVHPDFRWLLMGLVFLLVFVVRYAFGGKHRSCP